MAWGYLIVAGIFECVWSTFMKLSEGFSHFWYSVLTIITMAVSIIALALATKELPMSIAYPVWTGIGAIGAVIVGVTFFKDKISPLTIVFVGVLLVGIIGIQLTSK